ncbi:MAG: sensor histidine kinase [Bacteroidetes bacterium]|nr:sensor histidine kinase [Bacteroidota bacterium]
MKLSKYIFIFILFFQAKTTLSQDLFIQNKINQIDSLLDKYFSNYDQTEKEVNELLDLLTSKYNSKEYKGFKIDLMLQKAFLFSLKGNHHNALQISLQALDEAEEYKYPEKVYHCCWTIAIMYENGRAYNNCREYLDKAYDIYKNYKLDNLYSTYCIRMSSYFNCIQKTDSALYFAYRGLDYAQKYQNKRDIRDAYLLLGGLMSATNYKEAVNFKLLAAKIFIEIEDFSSAAIQFYRVASILLNVKQTTEAFRYNDSALLILKGTDAFIFPEIYKGRSALFEAIGNTDSALYFYQKYHDAYLTEQSRMEVIKISQISEQYQNEKNGSIIKSKEQMILFIGITLAIISLGSVILFRKNRQINRQNRIINKQVLDLSKTLEQKQVLLSELQHRVKNNLQHVISILEIQKESVDFNNIDELIRGNQNRIHSMALLHKKLNVSDNVDEVDLKKYITDLSELVKESYDDHKKKISLNVVCELTSVSLEKALPLGLMITELVSNSMKHAFKNRNIGIINIELKKDRVSGQSMLLYSDNGEGFDFNKKNEKGLGQELINGLIDQLDGTVHTNSQNGFELMVSFN